MQRVLIIGHEAATNEISKSPHLQTCTVEIADGDAEAQQHLRHRSFDVVLTHPLSTVNEDLALVSEMRSIRPGLRIIVLHRKRRLRMLLKSFELAYLHASVVHSTSKKLP